MCLGNDVTKHVAGIFQQPNFHFVQKEQNETCIVWYLSKKGDETHTNTSQR